MSVVELRKIKGTWKRVASRRARRIHGNTPMAFSGPVAGHPLLQTPAGNQPRGTLNNCADGQTPWGTYLTCEENFNGNPVLTNFPAPQDGTTIPRDCTFAISRKDGGIIGS